MKKVILIWLLIGGGIGFAYYMGTKVNEDIEPIVTVIDLTATQKKQIAQEAMLNWIPLDSAWTLAESFEAWNIIDSTHWLFKDSTVFNIIDSIAITYIPVFVGDDTTVTFDETVDEVRVQLSLAIKPRFFPLYNKFLTETQLQELTLTQPAKVDSWWKHRWVVYAGYGISYAQKTCYGEQSWCWSNGFQLGLGIRLY